MTLYVSNEDVLSGFNISFNQDWQNITNQAYEKAFYTQFKTHRDYFHHPVVQHLCFDVFSKTEDCYLLSVYKGERLIGYMGFRTVVKKIRFLKYPFLIPIATNVAEFNFPVVDPQYLKQFFEILTVVLAESNFYIEHVPGFFKVYFKRYMSRSFVRHTVDNPVIVLNDEIKEVANKKTLLKKKRRILRMHSLEVMHLDETIPTAVLDAFFALHIERWQRSGVRSNFTQTRFKEIYYRLAQINIEGVGKPILNCLKIDDEFLAIDLGFLMHEGRTYLAQISSSKINDKTSSAGSILNREILDYMAHIGVQTYNVGVGMETYKLRYMNQVDSYYTLVKLKSRLHTLYQRLMLK